MVLGLISVGVGAFAGLAQKNLKRLWAYSSIANVGYAIIGLSAGTAEGVQSMLMFMVLYMVDVTGFFACLAALKRQGRDMETFDDMAGLFKEQPGIALAMTAFSLSALGLPPFSGFWGKFYVFKAALNGGLPVAAALGLVGSVVAAFYYLRLIKVMWFDAATGQTDTPPIEARAIGIGLALFTFPVVLVRAALSGRRLAARRPRLRPRLAHWLTTRRSKPTTRSTPPTPRPAAARKPARAGRCGSPRAARPPAAAAAAGPGPPRPAISPRPC